MAEEVAQSLTSDEVELLRTLLAEREITRVLYRMARAVDRGDVELALSCYHPDAVEDHGGFVGPAREFVLRQGPIQLAETPAIQMMWHGIANITIEVDETEAVAESYTFTWQRLVLEDTPYDIPVVGRYLDEFSYRDGHWRISKRTLVFDASRVEPPTQSYWDKMNKPQDTLRLGARNATDLSYEHLRGPRRQCEQTE